MTSVLKKKRFGVLILLSVFIIIVALSPLLLSTSTALHFIVSEVNKKIPGSLNVESLLIDWQQGVLCQNITYRNTEQGISASIPTLTSNRGLLKLLLAPKNLGLIQVENPRLNLSGTSVQSLIAKGKGVWKDTGKDSYSKRNVSPFWDQVDFELESRGGQIQADRHDHETVIVLKEMSIDASFGTGVAKYDIRFQTMGQGIIEAVGSLNLPAHEQGWLETIVAETEIKINSLELAHFFPGVSSKLTFPKGDGQLNADFRLKTIGVGGLELDGIAELTNVNFKGGFLGDDQPSFRKINVAVSEGRWNGNGWSIKGFELASDTLSMRASGECTEEKKQLHAKGSLDLPVLFDQFPRFVNVHESTLVETGTVDFSADVFLISPDLNVKLKAKADNIGGIAKGQNFFWDSPIIFLFNGEKKDQVVNVHALQFDAPFARLKGSGGLHTFTMDGLLDVDKTLNDLTTLFQYDMSGSGKMEMSVKSGSVEEEERFQVDADIKIDDFTVRDRNMTVIPEHELSLIGGFKAPDTFLDQGRGELDLQIVLSAWLGEVFLVLNGEKVKGKPFRGYFTTDSELDLEQITSLLHFADIIDKETRITGGLQLQADGYAGEIPLEIGDFSAEATDVSIAGNDSVFKEPGVKITFSHPINEEVPFVSLRELEVAGSKDAFLSHGGGLNMIDLQSRKITLHDILLEADSGLVTVDRLLIPDWNNPFEGTRLQLALSADLEKITSGLHVFDLLPTDTDLSGASMLSLRWTGEHESSQDVDIELQVADLGVKRRNKPYIDSDDIVFKGKVQGHIPWGEMEVSQLKLQSNTLDLMATGNVKVQDELQLLELSGSIKPDLEKVGLILGHEFDFDLKMEGKTAEQFVFRYPLWRTFGENIGKVGFSSSIHTDRIVLNGIDLHEAVMPFHFTDGTLYTEMSSKLNDGRLEFITHTDLSNSPVVIKTSESSQILTGVKFNDALVSKLLSRFHPLLGGLAEPTGSIDVRLDSFWWPVGKEGNNEANFTVIFDVRDVQLKSSEEFKNILKIFGLEKEGLKLQDNEIYCIGNKDRIKCSPVRLASAETEFSMSGSVYTDKSIEYKMNFPITSRIVSSEEYQILQGTRINIDVRGTSDDPSYDPEAITSRIGSLKKQAADEMDKKS